MAVVGVVVIDVADVVENGALDAGDQTLWADDDRTLCGRVVPGTE